MTTGHTSERDGPPCDWFAAAQAGPERAQVGSVGTEEQPSVAVKGYSSDLFVHTERMTPKCRTCMRSLRSESSTSVV